MDKGISVIIITMNRCEELNKTIELLKEQKCKYPYEIIIVDQNSTDNTFECFSQICKPFRYVHLDRNYGVSGGRNRGAALSQYSYMVFLDDDAQFTTNNALEKIYEEIEKSEYNLFAFKILNLDGGFYNWPYKKSYKAKSDENFIAGTFIGCGHAIKTEFFNQVNGYSDILFFWGEESELVMKSVGFNGRAVQYLGDVNVIHRVKGNGRNTCDSKRFYYQVRNRLYLYKEMVPCLMFGYKIYYLFGYFIKALKNGWIKEWYLGIVDSHKMNIEYKKRMTLIDFLKYEMRYY